ncbi:riboflavin synthase [Woeseiaceae bacterium]|jgi:riboflavin synthase|nr:riboflavin synthase [Woeseiaceae bacterium]|tara:strand:+ start:25 stop:666 length:642 start_codon:yes stop_codon:yes gene_type:complete
MFTGIIKAMGSVERILSQGGDFRITFRADNIVWQDFQIGESIAVNGVCLTAIKIHEDGFDADVSGETMRVSAFRELAENTPVNLEPSLAIGERIGGHFVSGHIDCIGQVVSRQKDARSIAFEIDLPEKYARYIAAKGSVCIDGVSLTVNGIHNSVFTVNVIPHTADATVIGYYSVGDKVNIEVDLIARYLERLIDQPNNGVITKEFLKVNGYE